MAGLLRTLGQYSPLDIKARLIRTAHPRVQADGTVIRLHDAIAALQTNDTTVILRRKGADNQQLPDDVWPIPFDLYRHGVLGAFSGYSFGWCYRGPVGYEQDQFDYSRLARIDFAAIGPGDVNTRCFEAKIFLRDPYDPLRMEARPVIRIVKPKVTSGRVELDRRAAIRFAGPPPAQIVGSGSDFGPMRQIACWIVMLPLVHVPRPGPTPRPATLRGGRGVFRRQQ